MLKIESLRYFESVVRQCKSPSDVADQLRHEAQFDPEARAAVNDAASIMGGFSNWLDCAHWVIQWIGHDPRIGASAINKSHTYALPFWKPTPLQPWLANQAKSLLDREPECRCSSKALASYGHEKGCAYMAWKAEKKS